MRDLVWGSSEREAQLRRRVESFWNVDYLERIVLPLLAVPEGGRILDVGSGYGALTVLLAKLMPTAHVLGLDSEPKMVSEATELARQMSLTNLSFRQGDGYQLPFGAAVFDAVTCQTLLNNVANPEAIVREMVRTLKPGGSFLAVEGPGEGAVAERCNVCLQRDAEWYADRARLSRIYLLGKRRLGQGDGAIGARLPFLMLEAGLEIVDIRKNDRVWHAFPPYSKPNERAFLDSLRGRLDRQPSELMARLASKAIIAGGGTQAEVERYLEIMEDPEERERRSAAVEQGTYAGHSSINIYVFVGRKPEQR